MRTGDASDMLTVFHHNALDLITLADVSRMHFEGDVDESDVAKIKTGMPARIFVDAFPDTTFEGVLTRIAPQGIKEEGVVNFRVEAELSGDSGIMKTGMSADVQLVLDPPWDPRVDATDEGRAELGIWT